MLYPVSEETGERKAYSLFLEEPMEHSVKQLRGARIIARDGEIGSVDDLLFDDESWVVRYLVVDTGGWLTGRLVLVSPVSFQRVNWEERAIEVNLSRAQVEQSPELSAAQPVTREDEARYLEYYGYEPYWAGVASWGLGMYPTATPPVLGSAELARADLDPEIPGRREAAEAHRSQRNPHVRSAKELTGYHLHALDGEIGHVADFLLDAATFRIDSIVVDTKNWWVGKHVLVSPKSIGRVRWDERSVSVNLSRAAIESRPEFHERKSA